MPYECVLPDMDTTVDFKDENGNKICSVDVAELETIIIQCRIDDPHFQPTNPLSMNAWFGRCRNAISQRIGKQISIAVTAILIRKVMDTMKLLKKTMQYEQLWTSPQSMESMDSNTSTDQIPVSAGSPNSDYSTTTSLDSEQSKSLPNDTPMPA